MEDSARRAAEQAARLSYGKLTAFLAARGWNLTSIEDAIAEAFAAALEHWPKRGVPANPDAWLLTTARNHLRDEARKARVREVAAAELAPFEYLTEAMQDEFPDDRLKLLFVCAHPAIDRNIRTPLMLQTVLGLDAAAIAPAFLLSPATMSQRLVRVKNKIAAAKLRFEVPELAQLPARLTEVLEAIYAAFGAAWDDDTRWRGLSLEAIGLSRLMTELLPNEAETWGLLALLLHSEARKAARRSPTGAFVPLTEHDTQLWNYDLIQQAERALGQAAKIRKAIGPFQLEAAIQSAHASRAFTGHTPWQSIAELYDALAALSPTAGVLVGQAAAQGEAHGPEHGLKLLESLQQLRSYQPYWAARAHLLHRAGRRSEAHQAFRMAAGLATDSAVKAYLLRRAE